MKILNDSFGISTNKRCDMVDITDTISRLVSDSGISEGTVIIYCPHTTGAITINENADPDVVHDILLTLDQMVPHNRSGYRHGEGNSDAHVKSSMFGCNETVIISNGKMQLGTWQGVYFCEFDGPRKRRVNVRITGQ